MKTVIPSKDAVIQGITLASKFFAFVTGLAAYSNYIPDKYLGVAFFVFALASTFREGSTTVLSYLRGDKITLAPAAQPQPDSTNV